MAPVYYSNGKTMPYYLPCKTVLYLTDTNVYSNFMLAIIEFYTTVF